MHGRPSGLESYPWSKVQGDVLQTGYDIDATHPWGFPETCVAECAYNLFYEDAPYGAGYYSGCPATYTGQQVPTYFVYNIGGWNSVTQVEAGTATCSHTFLNLPWTPYWGAYMVEAPSQQNKVEPPISHSYSSAPVTFKNGVICSGADGCQTLAAAYDARESL